MRTRIKLIISGISFFLLSSCGDDGSNTWTKYTSSEGNFTISMPAHPKKWDKKEVTVFGKQTTHYITWKPTSFSLDKFKLFEVSYTDAPVRIGTDSARIGALLDSGINLRKKDFTEAEIESQVIELNGHPGRAFIYNPPRGTTIAIVKECIVGNRKYDLTAVAKQNYPTNAELNNFFNSFQVIK
jgi:hypothetical protein